jgi:hypothetical protein
VTDPEPFTCAECGTGEAETYVVTGAVDDYEGRTEVCLARHEALDDEDGPYGHCDTCGRPCDRQGCATDRTHVAAFDPLAGERCPHDGYSAIDAADLTEHNRLNHAA